MTWGRSAMWVRRPWRLGRWGGGGTSWRGWGVRFRGAWVGGGGGGLRGAGCGGRAVVAGSGVGEAGGAVAGEEPGDLAADPGDRDAGFLLAAAPGGAPVLLAEAGAGPGCGHHAVAERAAQVEVALAGAARLRAG